MRKFIKAAFIAAGLLAAINPALGQAQNGRGVGKQVVSISYYQVPPGKHDEWLALYKKWHQPIKDYELANGAAISDKIYASGSHAIQPAWDFAVVTVSPPAGEGKKLPLTRPELIRKLFPDLKAYTDGEKQRWALTIGHWDEKLVELDPHEEPFSVYWPIGGEAKKDK